MEVWHPYTPDGGVAHQASSKLVDAYQHMIVYCKLGVGMGRVWGLGMRLQSGVMVCACAPVASRSASRIRQGPSSCQRPLWR